MAEAPPVAETPPVARTPPVAIAPPDPVPPLPPVPIRPPVAGVPPVGVPPPVPVSPPEEVAPPTPILPPIPVSPPVAKPPLPAEPPAEDDVLDDTSSSGVRLHPVATATRARAHQDHRMGQEYHPQGSQTESAVNVPACVRSRSGDSGSPHAINFSSGRYLPSGSMVAARQSMQKVASFPSCPHTRHRKPGGPPAAS